MAIDISERVTDIIVFHLAAEEASVTENARLIDDLGADSLDVYEVVMSFEEAFNIEIPDHAVATLVTVGDAIALIKTKVGVTPEVGA